MTLQIMEIWITYQDIMEFTGEEFPSWWCWRCSNLYLHWTIVNEQTYLAPNYPVNGRSRSTFHPSHDPPLHHYFHQEYPFYPHPSSSFTVIRQYQWHFESLCFTSAVESRYCQGRREAFESRLKIHKMVSKCREKRKRNATINVSCH